jgi:hypothetical protein
MNSSAGGFRLILPCFRVFNGARVLTATNTLVLSLLAVMAGQAQTIDVNATFSSVPAGVDYDYTITLNNTASSTVGVETFWFGWVPGENFMKTSPISVTPPSGWTDTVTHGGAADGYAIQFATSTTPVNPGQNMMFQFTSADTPSEMAGNSVYYSTTPVGTSYVYENAPFASPSATFVAQPVPEPSALALLSIGSLTLIRRRVLLCRL